MRIRTSVAALSLYLLAVPLFAQDVTLSTGTPAEAGLDATILKAGVHLFEEAVRKDELRNVVLLVARHGKIALHEAIGWKDKKRGIPLKKDAMFRMASNTKPTIATAIGILADEGKLSYNDNVRKYLPSFDNYRSGFIKIYHLLTHTSGFRIKPLFFSPLIAKSAEHPNAPNLRLEVDRFGKVGATEPVGATYSYSNAGFNTLGALIEVISGQSLEQFLKMRIYTPLGMHDSYNHEIAGGIYNGKRILKEKTVKLMTSPQTASVYTPAERERQKSFYGYGWQVYKDGVFGHTGSDGTAAWVDPNHELIVLVFTQSPCKENPRTRFFKLVQTAIYQP